MRWLAICSIVLSLILLSGCQFAPSAPSASTSTADSPSMPFVLQSGYPNYLPAFTRPEDGCNWVGVAGQVFDAAGQPQGGVVVSIRGQFNGKAVDAWAVTGQQSSFADGGFELQVGDQSTRSTDTLTVQLFDAQSQPLSSAYPLSTFDDCQRNLILVNFEAQAEFSAVAASAP